MPIQVPEGWEEVSRPSTPQGYRTRLPDEFGVGQLKYDRSRTGRYEWVRAEGTLAVRGGCGQRVAFAGSFIVESSSTVTLNLGTLFNVPGAQEAVEIQVAAEYSWSSTTGVGISLQTEPLGEECYEYMAIPIVLKFEVCESYSVTQPALGEGGGFGYLLGTLVSYGAAVVAQLGLQRPADAFPGLLKRRECQTFYKEGGLLVCRRWCCGERGG